MKLTINLWMLVLLAGVNCNQLDVSMNYLFKCSGHHIGYKLVDPTDCTGYYLCHEDFMLQQYCASGSRFSAIQQKCIPGKCRPCDCDCAQCGMTSPPDTSCTTPTDSTPSPPTPDTPSPPSPPTDTTTTTDIPSTLNCTDQPHGALVPHQVHCRLYWQCVHGEAVLRFCEIGMWYDRKHFVCNYPVLVNCPENQD